MIAGDIGLLVTIYVLNSDFTTAFMNLGNDYVSEPQSSGVVKHKYLHRVIVRRKDHTHGSWLLVSQSKVILPTPPSGLPLPTEETPPPAPPKAVVWSSRSQRGPVRAGGTSSEPQQESWESRPPLDAAASTTALCGILLACQLLAHLSPCTRLPMVEPEWAF